MAETKSDRLTAKIVAAIESGAFSPGTRLKSLRAAALDHGVSKNTMVETYDRLVAQGYVEARHGAGFYVLQPAPARPAAVTARRVTEAVDTASLLREQLEHSFEVRLGEGRPPAEWVEGSVLKSHLRRLGGSGSSSLFLDTYESPAGYAPLRQLLAQNLADRSIRAHQDQILLTLGANHGLDLVIRQFLQPGDTALVDSPGYYPLFAKLKLAGVRMVGVTRRPSGPDPAELAAKAQATGARMFFTQSQAHNPTGYGLHLAEAHEILRIADRLDLTIVEDDAFGEIVPASAPRLAALDQLRRVIYVASFAKTLSANLRLGYVAASPDIAGALKDWKMLTIVNSSGYVERIVHAVLSDGHYRHHLKRLSARVEGARRRSLNLLRSMGLAPAETTDLAGFYVWSELPAGVDDIALTRHAAGEGIFLAPGTVFMPEQMPGGPHHLRLNIAYIDNPRFRRYVQQREQTGWQLPETV